MAPDISGYFTTPRRMTNMNCILHIERLNQRRKVVRVGVHVIAVPWLAGAAVSTAIVRYAAISVACEKKHLILERIRIQGPTMAENDRLARSPVLIVDLCSVLRRDHAHLTTSFEGLRGQGAGHVRLCSCRCIRPIRKHQAGQRPADHNVAARYKAGVTGAVVLGKHENIL